MSGTFGRDTDSVRYCGDGVYARRLAAAGFDVVGLDPAGAMIDLARERGGGPAYEVGGAGELRGVGPFDALVALNVLAYMTDAEMATLWSALEDQLRPAPPTYNVRANPLTYGDELAGHGLRLEAQAFFNFIRSRRRCSARATRGGSSIRTRSSACRAGSSKFQCSTLFALARR